MCGYLKPALAKGGGLRPPTFLKGLQGPGGHPDPLYLFIDLSGFVCALVVCVNSPVNRGEPW